MRVFIPFVEEKPGARCEERSKLVPCAPTWQPAFGCKEESQDQGSLGLLNSRGICLVAMSIEANPDSTVNHSTPAIFSAAVRAVKRFTARLGHGWAFEGFRSSVGWSAVVVVIHLFGVEVRAAAATVGLKERVFQESRQVFPNPERGFYSPVKTGRIRSLEGLRPQGISLLFVETDLREFKERDLSPEKLAEIRDSLNAARRAGLKVIFRAAYGYTDRDYRADPTDMDRILGHIRQMGAVLAENADVLCGLQAGMLGPWGEWHGSNWGDPPSLEARRKVLFAWLDALPAPITVDIRRPMFIRDIFADEPGGSTLSETTAYSGSRLSRTGFHDDSFLALPTDSGTFVEPGWDRQRELEWCSQHGRFTPSGGETVPTSARTPLSQVVREMELFHTSYLNIAYHGGTLQGWRRAEGQGENGFQQIARRLGYRLVAQRLRYPARAKSGETCRIELTLTNVGFASPHLPRAVAFALAQGDGRPTREYVLRDADPRRWGPEAGDVKLECEIPAPPDLRPGRGRLLIRFADPSAGLHEDGRYAIRLANEDIVFIEETGWNMLVDDIAIE